MKSEVFGAHAVPAYKDYSNDIHTSGQHLLGLINEILDLSRIEAGRYELNEEAISVADIVQDCHHLLKMRAKNRGITIHEVLRAGSAARMGGRARDPADLPQSSVQRDQVHAAGRRDLDQGRLDGVGRTIFQRQGYRPRHSGRRNPDRARVVRARIECDQIRRTGRGPWPADRQEPGRPAWRHLHAQIEIARRHRSHHRITARARDVGAGAARGARPVDPAAASATCRSCRSTSGPDQRKRQAFT